MCLYLGYAILICLNCENSTDYFLNFFYVHYVTLLNINMSIAHFFISEWNPIKWKWSCKFCLYNYLLIITWGLSLVVRQGRCGINLFVKCNSSDRMKKSSFDKYGADYPLLVTRLTWLNWALKPSKSYKNELIVSLGKLTKPRFICNCTQHWASR